MFNRPPAHEISDSLGAGKLAVLIGVEDIGCSKARQRFLKRFDQSYALVIDHLQQFFVLGKVALWVAVVTAVASAVDYYRRFSHVLIRVQGDL